MKTKSFIPVIALLLFVTGCAPYSVVSTDKDDATTDFTKYKTYAWLPDKDNSNDLLNNQIIRNNIKNYFTHELVGNYGFTANTNTPDVLLEFQVTVINKVNTEEHPVTNPVPNYSYSYPYPNNPYSQNPYSQNPYYTPQPNPYNYNGYGYNNNNFNNNNNNNNNNYSGYRYQTTYVKEQHNYTESTITINMIDRVRNELVWTASAQADIYNIYNESAYVKSQLHPAVHKLLKYFPLKPVKNKKQK
ncbi:MAG: DUF4136 domain-containing protein [Cyclobacteriaceae bacterium]|nr:DUF4136 domain-containing protein [Cyclobacteriaceae bacterium]